MTRYYEKDNLIGILLIILAMAGFAIEDSIIKLLTQRLNPGQIIVMIGSGGTLIFFFMLKLRGIPIQYRILQNFWVIGRSTAELFGTAFFVLSLALVPLTTVSAIIQVSPLLVTLGAALLLKEKVGIRRWSAIIIGLLGVAIILKPWTESFQVTAFLTLLGVVGLSARDLATRRVPKQIHSLVLAFLGFGATIPAGFILIAFNPVIWIPTWNETVLVLLGISIGVGSYYCIVMGMRLGEVSAIVPFRYSRLVFGAAIGVWYFGENLEISTLIGSTIVVVSGLYALWRETRLSLSQK